MNLHENILRINTLINEDKKEHTIRTIVDKMGLTNAIKMVGNYYMIEPYLKEIDKVNFIKKKVRELSEDNSGFGLVEIDEEPLHYSDEDGELHQIEWLGLTSVDISRYEDKFNGHLGDYYVRYESLPSEIIEQLVEILINK